MLYIFKFNNEKFWSYLEFRYWRGSAGVGNDLISSESHSGVILALEYQNESADCSIEVFDLVFMIYTYLCLLFKFFISYSNTSEMVLYVKQLLLQSIYETDKQVIRLQLFFLHVNVMNCKCSY